MVDSIFQKKPAFYHQLYDYLPGYENDVISVDVENDFQKNQLEMSKRAMLEQNPELKDFLQVLNFRIKD